MTLANATVRSGRQGPPGSRRPGQGRQDGRVPRIDRNAGTWFLVLPALIPILILSVGPLLYGIALAFTDARGCCVRSVRIRVRWLPVISRPAVRMVWGTVRTPGRRVSGS